MHAQHPTIWDAITAGAMLAIALALKDDAERMIFHRAGVFLVWIGWLALVSVGLNLTASLIGL